jgi:hypothetical protein
MAPLLPNRVCLLRGAWLEARGSSLRVVSGRSGSNPRHRGRQGSGDSGAETTPKLDGEWSGNVCKCPRVPDREVDRQGHVPA